MSTAQHTPGPWKAEGWENLVVNSADGCTMTLAAGGKGAVLAELKANAALIAAAPDLLAALEEIASRQISVQGYNSPSALLLRLASVQSLARATIARATGTEAEGAK